MTALAHPGDGPSGRTLGLAATIVAGLLALGLLASVVVAPSIWSRSRPSGLVTAPGGADVVTGTPQPPSTDLPSQAKLWALITGEAASAVPVPAAPGGVIPASAPGAAIADPGSPAPGPLLGLGGRSALGPVLVADQPAPLLFTPAPSPALTLAPAESTVASQPPPTADLAPAASVPTPTPNASGPAPTPTPTPPPSTPAVSPSGPATPVDVAPPPPPPPPAVTTPPAAVAPPVLVPAMTVPAPTIVAPVAVSIAPVTISAIPCPVLTGAAAGVAAIC